MTFTALVVACDDFGGVSHRGCGIERYRQYDDLMSMDKVCRVIGFADMKCVQQAQIGPGSQFKNDQII